MYSAETQDFNKNAVLYSNLASLVFQWGSDSAEDFDLKLCDFLQRAMWFFTKGNDMIFYKGQCAPPPPPQRPPGQQIGAIVYSKVNWKVVVLGTTYVSSYYF